MKCLVTGGAGFIGSNITDELIRLGHKVIIIDKLSLGKREYLSPEAKFHKLDIRNHKKIKPLFKGIDCVFHLAAQPRIQPSIINPAESFDNNVLGTFNVYGERQSTTGAYATVIGIFLKQKKSGKPLTIVGNGKQLRDFTYVGDVARANVAAMKSKKAIGRLINIGSGHNSSVNEVAKMIDEKHIYIPPRPGESRVTLADISKAEKLLGWKPRVSLEGWLKKQV